MEDLNSQNHPLFKKIDRAVFENIDKFKLTPGYTQLQDFYNSLEEEQQKLFKGAVILATFLIPFFILTFIWWQNGSLKDDLSMRIALVERSNEIIGKGQSLREIYPTVLSQSPIDGESMMTSRLSNLLSSAGVDLSKIQVNNFQGNMISGTVMKSEADFAFSNVSTDELMNIFTAMIQREKFRVESTEIIRNANTNLLQGKFHAVHLSQVTNEGEAE